MQIVRSATYATVPWKNGGGTTREALRMPTEGANFAWRVSLAQIERSGPFSDFAGYRRNMVLLQGRGVELRFKDASHSLKQIGDLIEFDGAKAAQCELLDGPCLDLNLMTANELAVTAGVHWLHEPWERRVAAEGYCLIMSLQGPLRLTAAGLVPEALKELDLAVLQGDGSLVLEAAGPHSGTPIPIFFATISYGRQS
jgi:uncharacterized protein